MRTSLEKLCNSFINNRDTIKRVFKWDNDLLVAICGMNFMNRGMIAQEERLEACKKLLKGETSVFSNFRGNVELPLISLLAVSQQPEELLKSETKRS